MVSLIWDNETEERKEYLAEQFREAFGIVRSDDLDTIANKIKKVAEQDVITDKQRDMLNYFDGEARPKGMIEELFEKAEDIIQEDFIEEIVTRETTRFKREKGKNYSVLFDTETKEEAKMFGFVKGEKREVRLEKFMIDKKEVIRYRDKRGRFASITKEF